MNKTAIAWTEFTWNPVTGCSKCSPECAHCYAEKLAHRWFKAGNPRYTNEFKVTEHPEALLEPTKKKLQSDSSNMCFVCSMGDLFHEEVSFDFIDKVLTVMANTPAITFQLLTKRDVRMAEFFSTRRVPQNVWLGVTCGSRQSLDRVKTLSQISAPVRFISAEPLLEDIAPELDLTGIDWVIVGGESGKDSRRMKEDWAWNLKVKSDESNVAFFFKQWGSIGQDGVLRSKRKNGNLLKGKVYNAYPTPRLSY